jgi:hypothetical protein
MLSDVSTRHTPRPKAALKIPNGRESSTAPPTRDFFEEVQKKIAVRHELIYFDEQLAYIRTPESLAATARSYDPGGSDPASGGELS